MTDIKTESKTEITTKFPNLKKVIIVPENLLSSDAGEYLKAKRFEFKQKFDKVQKTGGYVNIFFQETTMVDGNPVAKLEPIKRNSNENWDYASFTDMIQSIYLRMNYHRDKMGENIEIKTETKEITEVKEVK